MKRTTYGYNAGSTLGRNTLSVSRQTVLNDGIYNGLRRKATIVVPEYTEFMTDSGHTAPYAVHIPRDQSLLEQMGIPSKSTVPSYLAAIDRYIHGKINYATFHARTSKHGG